MYLWLFLGLMGVIITLLYFYFSHHVVYFGVLGGIMLIILGALTAANASTLSIDNCYLETLNSTCVGDCPYIADNVTRNYNYYTHSTTGFYLWNDSLQIYFNETQLNNTIDARAGAGSHTTSLPASNITDEGNLNISNANITANSINASVDCTLISGGSDGDYCSDASGSGTGGFNVTGFYLYENSTHHLFNETMLNATIDARDTDTDTIVTTLPYANITGTPQINDSVSQVNILTANLSANSTEMQLLNIRQSADNNTQDDLISSVMTNLSEKTLVDFGWSGVSDLQDANVSDTLTCSVWSVWDGIQLEWANVTGEPSFLTAVTGSSPIASTGGTTPDISLTTCSDGQIYKMSGGNWVCSADATGGGSDFDASDLFNKTSGDTVYGSGLEIGTGINITFEGSSAMIYVNENGVLTFRGGS